MQRYPSYSVSTNIYTRKFAGVPTKDNSFSWGLGIAPGLAIPVSENLSFVGHLGRVGYYNDTFELGVNGNYFTVGAYYSF
ncbi:MAG: hypothetical protein IJ652_04385 [Bacteroidales bacterium]|nr:hypothetical protein [Bacteroidales bacterium]